MCMEEERRRNNAKFSGHYVHPRTHYVRTNNASLEELNLADGLILYKGHSKDKTSDRAYRTNSSCPFLSKAIDLYLREFSISLVRTISTPARSPPGRTAPAPRRSSRGWIPEMQNVWSHGPGGKRHF